MFRNNRFEDAEMFYKRGGDVDRELKARAFARAEEANKLCTDIRDELHRQAVKVAEKRAREKELPVDAFTIEEISDHQLGEHLLRTHATATERRARALLMESADLFMRTRPSLPDRAADALERAGEFRNASAIYEEHAYPERAAECLERSGDWVASAEYVLLIILLLTYLLCFLR